MLQAPRQTVGDGVRDVPACPLDTTEEEGGQCTHQLKGWWRKGHTWVPWEVTKVWTEPGAARLCQQGQERAACPASFPLTTSIVGAVSTPKIN